MPVLSIIGGYLGTGKSTVVNRLLTGVLPGRIAVVVNDFGAVNIDADLIASTGEDTIELTNGCICCQIGDDVQRTMSALARRNDLHHVVCEVSGVGNPSQLATWRDFPGFSRGPIVVCADATATRRLVQNEFIGDTVTNQFAAAESILVTKTDLATAAHTDETAAIVHELAPHAEIYLQDAADPTATVRHLFAPGSENLEGGHEDIRGWQIRRSAVPAYSSDGHVDRHRAITVTCPSPVDLEHLAACLEGLSVWLIRAKGVVQDTNGAWHEIHLAGGRVSTVPRRADLPAPHSASLVLIAVGPDAKQKLNASVSAVKPLVDANAP